MSRKLIVAVVDGLEARGARGGDRVRGRADLRPARGARELRARGLRLSSLTPVCLSSIATGVGPDGHGIPHLVWYDRAERRVVEYGSIVRRASVAGHRPDRPRRPREHECGAPVAGRGDRVRGARGRRSHDRRGQLHRVPRSHDAHGRGAVSRSVRGPQRFFFYGLWQSDRTGAPPSWRRHGAGASTRTPRRRAAGS